ncbi:IgGFc-binding protein [Flavobacterium sp. 2]|uniref:IgGFc-binding protein n=1 Tax=Flavobacterium sp. 2 TaxID=308053 RepID=UPI000C1890A5|nr:IgGFc-binding protein [Flavobacterium sp. 2]
MVRNPNLAAVALLKNNTNSFASATTITGGTLTGANNDFLEFNGVNLSDGDYFTLSLGEITAPGTFDFEYWYGVPRWDPLFRTPQTLHFSGISSTDYATYVIDMPADPGFAPIAGTLYPGGARTVDLIPFINAITVEPANTILNRGLRIRVKGKLGAYYASEDVNNYGTMPLRGPNALGTSFIIPGQDAYINSTIYPDSRAMFVVTATQDGTQVTITSAEPIIGHGANVTFVITLNKGQSYSADAATGSGNHLAGSLVSSNLPVVITYNDDLLVFSRTAADNAGDQLVPVSKFGLEYVHIRANLAQGGELAYIFASEDNTSIAIFDGTTTKKCNIKQRRF